MGIRPIEAYAPAGTQAVPSLHGFEAAAQAYSIGDILITSSGKLAIAGADAAAATIVGLALSDATGTTDTDRMYQPLVPYVSYVVANFDDALSGSDAPLTHVAAIADLYSAYSYAVDGVTGHFYIEQDDTSPGLFKLMQFIDPIGTIAARAIFLYVGGA